MSLKFKAMAVYIIVVVWMSLVFGKNYCNCWSNLVKQTYIWCFIYDRQKGYLNRYFDKNFVNKSRFEWII